MYDLNMNIIQINLSFVLLVFIYLSFELTVNCDLSHILIAFIPFHRRNIVNLCFISILTEHEIIKTYLTFEKRSKSTVQIHWDAINGDNPVMRVIFTA